MNKFKKLSMLSLTFIMVMVMSGFNTLKPVRAENDLMQGDLFMVAGDSAVYYLGADNTKYTFTHEKAYMSWYENFDGVVEVSTEDWMSFTDGGYITYRPGSYLIKNTVDPNVYAVEPGGTIRKITSEDQAISLYGMYWADSVRDVISTSFTGLGYTVGDDVADESYPSGTLVSLDDTTYYVDGDSVRPFADADSFEINNFNWDFVLSVDSLDAYSMGESVDAEEASLAGYEAPEGGAGTSTGDDSVDGELTVSLSAATPDSGIVVGNAARVPFTKVSFVNSGSADITVDSMMVERTGLAQDAVFSSLDVLDGGTMLPLNNSSKTLGSEHTATFNDDFVVEGNSTMVVILAANMGTLSSYAGETPALSLISVTLAEGEASGSLPITGNDMTINGTLTIGSATVAAGGNNPSAATKEVGTTDYVASSYRVTAGSAEKITVEQIVFTNNGSSDPEDVANVELLNTNSGEVLCSFETLDDDAFVCSDLGVLIDKGDNVTFDLRMDILGGSGSTISYDIDKQADMIVVGDTYGYNVLPTYPNSGEPYFDSNNVTIGDGTLRIESMSVTPTNITEGLSDVVLGKFKFVAKGEAMNITSIGWNFALTTTTDGALWSDITNVVVYDGDGNSVAGPVDPVKDSTEGGTSNFTATTTDTLTIPVGEVEYTVKGKLSNDFGAGDTLQAGISIGAATIKGDVTGNTVTGTPSTKVQSTSLTVRSAALALSVSSEPASQTVVAGQNGFLAANFIFDASTSGDDIEITAIKPSLHTTGASYPDQFSGWTLWDGTSEVTIDADSTTCSGATCSTAATQSTTTLTLANDSLIVAAGSTKTITVKVNVSSASTSGTFAVGLSSAMGVSAIDSDAQTVTPTGTDSNGQSMTLAAGGTLNVALGTDPVSAFVVAGTTAEVGRFTMQAKYEGLDFNYFGFQLASPDGGVVGNQDELTTLYLYEEGGSEALGSVAMTCANATITPADMTMDVNDETTYVVKAVFSSLGDASPASSGAGLRVALTNIDVDGTSTGSSSVTVNGLGSNFNTFSIFKSVPTVTVYDSDGADVITGNDTFSLMKFSVTADGAGPIGLYKFMFGVSTTTVAMSSTSYYLYESDSDSTLGDVIAQGADFMSLYDADGGATVVHAYLDVNDDNGDSPALEHRILSAGTTKYYTLRGTVASGHDNTGDNESISTVLAGDAGFVGTAAQAAGASASDADGNSFVWSDLNFDLYSTSTATNNVGWWNGYRVEGMVNTSSTAEVITD